MAIHPAAITTASGLPVMPKMGRNAMRNVWEGVKEDLL